MMKKMLTNIIVRSFLIYFVLIFFSSIHGMLTRVRSVPIITAPRIPAKPTSPTIQKRAVSTPEQLKQFTVLSQAAKKVSPTFGAAKWTSGSLQKMYTTESTAAAVRLVQELFNQLGPLFRPTALKSKAAYALTPSVLGFIIGALETHKINAPKARKEIIDLWKAEYRGMTSGDKLSENKISLLLNVIDTAYQEDRNHTLSILLAFLYAKASPDNNHDMIHYLFSLQKYMPIFESEEAPASTITSFTARFTSALQKLKSAFYGPQEYATLQQHFENISEETAINSATQEKFEATVATIINQLEQSLVYPPQVIQTEHGYKGKPPVPNCVEAALHDFFNIIVYNPSTRTFDVSLLPSTLQPTDTFKHFYELQKDISNVNSPTVTQAFMDMVSGIKEIQYVQDNYELEPAVFEKNMFALFNYFLGISVKNFDELAKALSNEQRTFNFSVAHNISTNFGTATKISIEIINNKEETQQAAYIYFTPNHGWIDVPNRSRKTSNYFLNPHELAKNYKLSPQAQALFSLQPDPHVLQYDLDFGISSKTPTSFYYNFEANSDPEKYNIIQHIIHFSSDDNEATDYAYTLYQQLDPDNQISAFFRIIKTGINKKNKKFENIFNFLKPRTRWDRKNIIDAIVTYDKHNQAAVDYAYELYQRLHNFDQLSLVDTILKSGVQKTDHNFKNIYSLLTLQSDDDKVGLVKSILMYDNENHDSLEKAYEIYKTLPLRNAHQLFETIMISGAWKINNHFAHLFVHNTYYALSAAVHTDLFNVDTIKTLYNKMVDSEKKKRFLTIALNAAQTINDYRIANDYRIMNNNKEMSISDGEFVAIAKELLSQGCDVNAPSQIRASINLTPIFFAITINSAPLLETLIENGANIHEQITSNSFMIASYNAMRTNTPLSFAIEEDKKEAIKILLKHGADINAKISIDPDNNITPLIKAAMEEKSAIVKILLENGANPNIEGRINGKIVTPLFEVLKRLKVDNNKMTAELIKYGVNLDAIDSDGNTALDVALNTYERLGRMNNIDETIAILKAAGAQARKTHIKTSYAEME